MKNLKLELDLGEQGSGLDVKITPFVFPLQNAELEMAAELLVDNLAKALDPTPIEGEVEYSGDIPIKLPVITILHHTFTESIDIPYDIKLSIVDEPATAEGQAP